jgi:hypothetical protein
MVSMRIRSASGTAGTNIHPACFDIVVFLWIFRRRWFSEMESSDRALVVGLLIINQSWNEHLVSNNY